MVRSLLVAMALSCLVACNTAQGVKKDVAVGAEKTGEALKKGGEAVEGALQKGGEAVGGVIKKGGEAVQKVVE
mgnify:CR=1 FL=1